MKVGQMILEVIARLQAAPQQQQQQPPREEDMTAATQDVELDMLDTSSDDDDGGDDDDFIERCWIYYNSNFHVHPQRAADLLLGVALNNGAEWWLPHEHPIAALLLRHNYQPETECNALGLLCYDRNQVSLGQESLQALFHDKALGNQGALWEICETNE